VLQTKNNPKGYYEYEKVKYLQTEDAFLDDVGDRCVKVVAPLLKFLPDRFRYKIIFMERELGEILLSQHKMLKRDKKKDKKDSFSFALWKNYEELLNKVKDTYRKEPNVKMLYVSHREVIEDPVAIASQVSKFLGKKMDVKSMARVVDPSLYREQENVLST
jgi:hypothetical protein